MPFKIVRNDIIQMNTEAIVNTANDHPTVGTGCDRAIYMAAGFDQLLEYRQSKIGFVPEGEAFVTPGFNLTAKYIIHAVSPLFQDGKQGEKQKLRSCYQRALALADELGVLSIAFPMISTGGFGYPLEEGMRIAVDEIRGFLRNHEMDITLVVFDEEATKIGETLYSGLESYIDCNYVKEKNFQEYEMDSIGVMREEVCEPKMVSWDDDIHESKLEERMEHLTDTFSEYLLYLIESKGLDNVTVYKKSIVDRKVFSKIKNHKAYHPQKMTVLCLCIGARLNLDEAIDLLARAGYALSPCDKTDIIFQYFIENEIYDMIELDIQLEEHGLPCIIS